MKYNAIKDEHKHSIGDLVYVNLGSVKDIGIVQAYIGQGEAVPKYRVHLGSRAILVRASDLRKL